MNDHPINRLLASNPAALDFLYVVNVEAAVFHAGRYLMIVRGQNEENAPGTLSFPGGKIERAGDARDIIETTLRREIGEEAGVEVAPELLYVKSKSFTGSDGKPIIDLLFLARYISGVPAVSASAQPGEIAGLAWMTLEEVLEHPLAPTWTRADLLDAETLRMKLGW